MYTHLYLCAIVCMSRIFFSNQKLKMKINIKNLFIYFIYLKLRYYILFDPEGGGVASQVKIYLEGLCRYITLQTTVLFLNKIMKKNKPIKFGIEFYTK